MRSLTLGLLALATLTLAPACGHDHSAGGHTHGPGEDDHADDHPDAGPHGGELLDVGDHAGHLEVLHDAAAGRLTVWVLGEDASTPLACDRPPELKLVTDAGPAVLAFAADGDGWTVTDERLVGGEPHGRVSVYTDGAVYNPELHH